MTRRFTNRALLLGFAGLALLPGAAPACSVCFGNPDSDLTRGMNMGVLAMLSILLVVLAGFASLIVFLVRRAAARPLLPDPKPGPTLPR